MLALDSLRWRELDHARGDGGDIPALLRELEAQRPLLLSEQVEQPLWDLIWDRLEHQLTVYDASYAVVPHVIRIAGLSNQTPGQRTSSASMKCATNSRELAGAIIWETEHTKPD